MRSSTTLAPSVALILACLAGGCAGNSTIVERFDPAGAEPPPTGAGQTTPGALPIKVVHNRPAPKSDRSFAATNPTSNAASAAPALRTGPITPEWIAQMEASGRRSGAPVIQTAPGP
ncbi:MAG: hypothetical protein K2Q09_12035, partial [Phycisphaerales bacterium]|nr:hypothetical protein [Phycisphaerales bacterium]